MAAAWNLVYRVSGSYVINFLNILYDRLSLVWLLQLFNLLFMGIFFLAVWSTVFPALHFFSQSIRLMVRITLFWSRQLWLGCIGHLSHVNRCLSSLIFHGESFILRQRVRLIFFSCEVSSIFIKIWRRHKWLSLFSSRCTFWLFDNLWVIIKICFQDAELPLNRLILNYDLWIVAVKLRN